MITRIVITRASVPRLVAIAIAIAIEGNENRHLASSSSRVPCPSPASVNSHCHRNPTQSRIPKTHYPRPSSSSSSSSWPRMTRAPRTTSRPRSQRPRRPRPRGLMCIRTFDALRSIDMYDVPIHVRVHRTFMYVYTCFLYPNARARRFFVSRELGSGESPPITTSTHAWDSTATNDVQGGRGGRGRGFCCFAREVVIAEAWWVTTTTTTT